MAEHNTILYILHSQSCSQIVADRKEELWLHPVINNMQLVLSVGYYGQTVCFGGSEDTSFFIYGLVSNVNLNSCTLFHLYRKQAIFFREEDELAPLVFCVFKESTVWRQIWSPLYNLGISLSTGGRVLDTSDTQVYMFVFCFWKGKNTGRTVITIKEEVCPQILCVFLHCSHV